MTAGLTSKVFAIIIERHSVRFLRKAFSVLFLPQFIYHLLQFFPAQVHPPDGPEQQGQTWDREEMLETTCRNIEIKR